MSGTEKEGGGKRREINYKSEGWHWEWLNPKSHEGVNLTPPTIFLALNFCSFTDCQKLWHNCSLFVNTSFDTN